MNDDVKKRIIESYQTEGGGFIVHTAEQLKKIYDAYGIDPRSLDRRIFEIESLSHFLQKGVIELFKALDIKKGDKVLSLGEGNGAPSRLLVKLVGCKVTGVDINPEQVKKAKECAVLANVEDKVEYVLQNVEELDLPEKNYDKAYCNETVGHWENKEEAFFRIYNHLKKGAKIGFNLWIRGDKGDLNDAYEEVESFRDLYRPYIWFQLSLDELVNILEKVGFRLISKKDVTDEVDARMRARLKAIKIANARKDDKYVKIMGKKAAEMAEKYYEGMIDVNYDYLRYARLIMEKS